MSEKQCGKCFKSKTLDQFNKKGKGYSSFCKECNKEYLKEHYINNKQYYIDKRDARRKRIKKQYNDYKRSLKCFDCHYSFQNYPNVCDFHHLDNTKDFDIGTAIANMINWNKLMKEIEKCIPLCSNCHRIRHYYENGFESL